MKRVILFLATLLVPFWVQAQNLEIWCIWADGSSGTGTLVRGPNGTVVLLDEGGGASWASYCKDVMDANSISYIDYAIACHYDSDHVGGLDNLWALMGSSHSNFGAYWDRGGNERDDGSSIPSDYYDLVNPSGKRATPDVDGADDIDLGNGAVLQILSVGAPNTTNALYIRNRSDVTTGITENNKSISVLVTYGGFDFYFGSDLEGTGEKAVDDVVVTDLGRGVDVLHVDHHGSDTYDISSAEFFGNMDPEVAVISVWGNSFQHPRATTVTNLQGVVEPDTQRIIRLDPGDDTPPNDDWAPENMSYCVTTNDHVKITVPGSTYTVSGNGITDTDLVDHATDDGGGTTTTTVSTTTSTSTTTTLPGAASVVINEIAWSGTASSYSDEWIEFYNTTDSPIDIATWSISGVNGGPLNFSDADGSTTTVVPAGGYLIYANDQDVFSSGATEHIWDLTINIPDTYGQIVLYNAPNGGGSVVDTAGDGGQYWFAGDSGTDTSMERKDPANDGTDSASWADFSGTPFAKDNSSNDVNGSPGALNSVYTGTTTTTSTTTTITTTTTTTTTTTLPPATHLLITEVAVDANAPSGHDWIEIYLPTGATAVDVSGVYITDLDDDYQIGNNGTLTMQPGDVLVMHDASGTSENDSSGKGDGVWDVYFGTGPTWASTDDQFVLTTEGSADPDPENIIDAVCISNDDGGMLNDPKKDGNKLIDYSEWGDPNKGQGAFAPNFQGPAIGDINNGYARRTGLSDSDSVGDWEISATQDQGTPPAGDLTGDLDLDNDVDAADLDILVGNWGGSGSGDLDESGTVEEEDLGIQMSNWTG